MEDVSSGGGSAIVWPYYTVSALEDIKQAMVHLAPTNEVMFSQGCFKHELLPLLETRSNDKMGLKLEFFDRDFANGKEAQNIMELHSDTARMLYFDCLPKEVGPVAWIRCSGKFYPATSGIFEFGVLTTGRARLYIDGQLLVDNWIEQERSSHFFGKLPLVLFWQPL